MSGGYTGLPPAYYNENATQGYYEAGSPELGAYNTAYGLSTTDGNVGGFTGLLAPGGYNRQVTGIMTGGMKNKRPSKKLASKKPKNVKKTSKKTKKLMSNKINVKQNNAKNNNVKRNNVKKTASKKQR